MSDETQELIANLTKRIEFLKERNIYKNESLDRHELKVKQLRRENAELRENLNGWREESRKMTADNLRLCDEIALLKA